MRLPRPRLPLPPLDLAEWHIYTGIAALALGAGLAAGVAVALMVLGTLLTVIGYLIALAPPAEAAVPASPPAPRPRQSRYEPEDIGLALVTDQPDEAAR
jgi:hypothetical protein